jgi:hypothetical protein
MRLPTLAAAALFAVGLAACSDSPAGIDGATEQDRQAVVEELDASGWFADAFGIDGTAEDLDRAVSFDLGLSPSAVQDTVPLVWRWGRRHGAPESREITVTITGDTARVEAVVTFDGVFVLDRTFDSVANPTRKPLQEQAVQYATLVRRPAGDTTGRAWRLVALSPREWRMTDEAKRTVALTRVVVRVNGEMKVDVTDPAELFDVNNRSWAIR